MKASLSVCLLLSFLLLSQVQGIRLEKGFSSAGNRNIQVEASPIKITGNGGLVGEVIICRDGHCSSGINRKLMNQTTSTPTTTTTTTNSKNAKNEGKSGDQVPGRQEENFNVNSSPVSEHREAAPESYPDILDIAGMDYSPARRKPPIHN